MCSFNFYQQSVDAIKVLSDKDELRVGQLYLRIFSSKNYLIYVAEPTFWNELIGEFNMKNLAGRSSQIECTPCFALDTKKM